MGATSFPAASVQASTDKIQTAGLAWRVLDIQGSTAVRLARAAPATPSRQSVWREVPVTLYMHLEAALGFPVQAVPMGYTAVRVAVPASTASQVPVGGL